MVIDRAAYGSHPSAAEDWRQGHQVRSQQFESVTKGICIVFVMIVDDQKKKKLLHSTYCLVIFFLFHYTLFCKSELNLI